MLRGSGQRSHDSRLRYCTSMTRPTLYGATFRTRVPPDVWWKRQTRCQGGDRLVGAEGQNPGSRPCAGRRRVPHCGDEWARIRFNGMSSVERENFAPFPEVRAANHPRATQGKAKAATCNWSRSGVSLSRSLFTWGQSTQPGNLIHFLGTEPFLCSETLMV